MVAYREPDGFEKTIMVLASLSHEVRTEEKRLRAMVVQFIVFASLFAVLVGGETLFSIMLFSIIQVEILGQIFSGAAFALLTPTVIGYAHVRLHREGDHFLRWWLHTLSGIGILVFAVGVSLSLGYAAWQAAQDAVNVIASGTTGTFAGQSVGGGADASSDIAGWLAIIPNALLFAGLAFAMLITISFASFALGRALEAWNILALTPRIGKEVKERIAATTVKIRAFRKLRDADIAERRKLPFDIKAKFAREAAYACWKAGQEKLAAARRYFDPVHRNDPLAAIVGDPHARSIPGTFASEADLNRHMAEQMDATRVHNILRVLSGLPEGKDQI